MGFWSLRSVLFSRCLDIALVIPGVGDGADVMALQSEVYRQACLGDTTLRHGANSTISDAEQWLERRK